MIRTALAHAIARTPAFIRAAHLEENGAPSSRRVQVSAAVAIALLIIVVDVALHRGLRTESIELTKFVVEMVLLYVGVTRVANR